MGVAGNMANVVQATGKRSKGCGPAPTDAATKAQIVAWLDCAGIDHDPSLTKAGLLALVPG